MRQRILRKLEFTEIDIGADYRNQELRALVVELVDTRDLKSLGVRAVPVQVRPGAPYIKTSTEMLGFFYCQKKISP